MAGFFYPVEISITPCTPSRGICGAPWAPVAADGFRRKTTRAIVASKKIMSSGYLSAKLALTSKQTN
jgi:hypothetical protein